MLRVFATLTRLILQSQHGILESCTTCSLIWPRQVCLLTELSHWQILRLTPIMSRTSDIPSPKTFMCTHHLNSSESTQDHVGSMCRNWKPSVLGWVTKARSRGIKGQLREVRGTGLALCRLRNAGGTVYWNGQLILVDRRATLPHTL